MLKFLRKIFGNHPEGFPVAVDVHYVGKQIAEGRLITGDQLFSQGAGHRLKPLVFSKFVFWYNDLRREFNINDKNLEFEPQFGKTYKAHANRNINRILFMDHDLVVWTRELDADEDEDDEDWD